MHEKDKLVIAQTLVEKEQELKALRVENLELYERLEKARKVFREYQGEFERLLNFMDERFKARANDSK